MIIGIDIGNTHIVTGLKMNIFHILITSQNLIKLKLKK